jgi:AcrR family transcriptional regulator
MKKREAGKVMLKTAKAARRAPYHHGDLREALIAAARQLVMERGAENFTLADACRVAGVTTAAPYRHFRSKQEILEEICSRGFDQLKSEALAVIAEKGPGTLNAIVAMGQAYVAFAVNETPLFRLMFGQEPSLKAAEHVAGTGTDCFTHLIEQITIYCQRNRVRGDTLEIAIRLWTFVHGAASLLIDNDYLQVVPQLDVNNLIANAVPGLLAPAPRPARERGKRGQAPRVDPRS